jgi:MscS family membrane protein
MDFLTTKVFYGDTLGSWLISVAILIGSFVAARLLLWLLKQVLSKIVSRTKTSIDDLILENGEKPIVFAVILIGLYIAIFRLHLSKTLDTYLTDIFDVLIILNVTWFVSRIIDGMIVLYLTPLSGKTGKVDDNVIRLLRKTLNGVLWTIGIVVALNNTGLNVGAIIAGLGIGGVAVALAAQDTIKNIFAGIVIFVDRPFKLGDEVRIDTNYGNVEDIGLRSVRIRTYDKRLLTMSSSKVIDSVVENITKEPARRIVMTLSLDYDTTPQQMEKALEILKSMPSKIPGIKDVQTYFVKYAQTSLDIMFIYFIKKGEDIIETQSKVNISILENFNANKLKFASSTNIVVSSN